MIVSWKLQKGKKCFKDKKDMMIINKNLILKHILNRQEYIKLMVKNKNM